MEFLIVLIVGFVILFGTAAAYFFFGNFLQGFSGSNADWASYGDYFGGVAGPLLSFLGTLLVVYTIRQQGKQLRVLEEENRKQDMLRYIDVIKSDISHVLSRKIYVSNERYGEIGDIVFGIENPPAKDEYAYRAAMEELLKLTCAYCNAIDLYRENINSHFVYRAHYQKAKDLVEHLESCKNILSKMAGPSLAMCRHQLFGEDSA